MNKKIKRIEEIVKKELSCSAHKIDHTKRVYNLSLFLAKKEKADLEVLEASALLHDIARVKEDNDNSGKTDHAVLGAKMARSILIRLGFSKEKIKDIQECILSHRYRSNNKPKTIEAKILFDADKLDTVGAIGIARNFIWIGRNKANLYTPKSYLKGYVKDNLGGDINGRIRDKRKHSPQVEFETKTKFLEDKLYTKEAKRICKKRMKFYKEFLDRLEREIEGKI